MIKEFRVGGGGWRSTGGIKLDEAEVSVPRSGPREPNDIVVSRGIFPHTKLPTTNSLL